MAGRFVVWAGEEGWRAEASAVELDADGLRARGTQIGADPLTYRAHYRLDATAPGFVTRSLRVEVTGEGWSRNLLLERAEGGAWSAETDATGDVDLPPPGGDTDAFAGALDCDLALSPLTNAMPVLRHRLHERDGQETFLMAWVSVPDLSLHASRQHYTHVRTSDSGATVRYESESRDFVAELELDRDGLVIHYPQIGRRVEPGD
jgi:uncharacterized protein